MKKELNRDELIAFMKNHTLQEAGEYFGRHKNALGDKLRSWGYSYYDLKYGDYPKQLNALQCDVVTGTLLGDASLSTHGYRFSQALVNKEYVEHVHDILMPFCSNGININRSKKPNNKNGKVLDIATWNGEWCYHCYCYTIATPFLKQLWHKWYPQGKKIVPLDLQLTPRSLAYWYMDDGSNAPSSKRIILYTMGFSKIDVLVLVSAMKQQLDISSYIALNNKKLTIQIAARSYFDFVDMVTPYVNKIACLTYKVDVSQAPKTRRSWGACKLNHQKAKEIRELYNTGDFTQGQLSSMFDVSATTINKIINNRTYPETDMHMTGQADATLKISYVGEGKYRHGN